MSQIKLSSQVIEKIQEIALDDLDFYVNQENNTSSGDVYFIINDDIQVAIEFEADVSIEYEVGEVWGNYVYCDPTATITKVYNIKKHMKYALDEYGEEIEITLSEEANASLNEYIEKIIYEYEELDAGDKYEYYSDPTL